MQMSELTTSQDEGHNSIKPPVVIWDFALTLIDRPRRQNTLSYLGIIFFLCNTLERALKFGFPLFD